MRCSECDQIILKQCVGRLPNNQTVFGWCPGCVEVAGGQFVEITNRVNLFSHGQMVALPMGGTSWNSEESHSQKRFFALRLIAFVLAYWGLTMTIAGLAHQPEPTPTQPSGEQHARFLIGAGGCLFGTASGLLFGIWRIRRKQQKLFKTFHKNRFALHKQWRHIPAILGFMLLTPMVFSTSPQFWALGVAGAIPCFATSWLLLYRATPKSPVKKSEQMKPLEIL